MGGLCCSKTADWSSVTPLQNIDTSDPDKPTFTLKVRVGNPCVPGSYWGGPIMYDMQFEVDLSSQKLKVSGYQSRFPAYEVVHGRSKARNGDALRWGVSGENVYSLMGKMARIGNNIMDLQQ